MNKLLITTTILFGVLLSGEVYASNCPPMRAQAILAPDSLSTLVAEVTVLRHLPAKPNQDAGSIEVQVSRVFAGEMGIDKIVLDSTYYSSFGGCGTRLHGIPIGTQWMIAVNGPNASGSFGGSWADSFAIIDGDEVEGNLFPDQCDLPNPNNCVSVSETLSLDEFTKFAEMLSPGMETDDYVFEVFPAQPTESDLVWLQVTKKDSAVCNLFENAISVDGTSAEIKVSLHANSLTFTGCQTPDVQRLLIGDLSDPHRSMGYSVQIFLDSTLPTEPRYAPENLVADFALGFRSNPPFAASPETPAAGSIQSGVGVIRGWACDAKRVEVQFDDLPRIDVSYGTTRNDTQVICGDSNNGYGMVFAWGLLGIGPHTMTTFVDDREVARVDFDVAGLDSPFVKDIEGTYELEDFPAPGETAVVRWSEADQNFIIVEIKP